MSKRLGLMISITTLIIVLFLSLLVITSIDKVNHNIEQNGFMNLEITNKRLAIEVKKAFDSDRLVLTAMANVLSVLEDPTYEDIKDVINAYNFETSYTSYTSLLLPNNMMVLQDGSSRDVTGLLDFDKEVSLGTYITDRIESVLYDNKLAIRHAVPVTKDDEVIYILYAVTLLSDLSNKFELNIYDNRAYIFIEDGKTEQFLIDTYHDYLGNLSDFENRKPEKGYDWELIKDDLAHNHSGIFSFVSESTGRVQYLRYDPIGINAWNIMLMVPKEVVMASYDDISSNLYLMGALIGVSMFLYTALLSFNLISAYKKVKKLSNEDQTTGLQNRNSFELYTAALENKMMVNVGVVYIDVNGLHALNNQYNHYVGDKLLQNVANLLLKAFNFKQVYRVGGDEFVVICEDMTYEEIIQKMELIANLIKTDEYSIAYGIAYSKALTGINKLIQEADEIMLISKRNYYKMNDLEER